MGGLQIWKFQDSGVANQNGGIYGPYQFTAMGLMFLGYTTPDATNPSLNNAQIRVHPGSKPTFETGNEGIYPALAVDGIPLTTGQYFRLSGKEQTWYFSLLPNGQNLQRTFWFAVIPDECFEAGTLNLLTPPASYNASADDNSGALALVSAIPVTLRGWYIFNEDAATTFLQIFDAAKVADVILGTTPPTISLGVPAGAGANLIGIVRDFVNGIVVAATTTRDGNTAPGAPLDWNLFL